MLHNERLRHLDDNRRSISKMQSKSLQSRIFCRLRGMVLSKTGIDQRKRCSSLLTLVCIGLMGLTLAVGCQQKGESTPHIPLVKLVVDGQERHFETRVETVGDLLEVRDSRSGDTFLFPFTRTVVPDIRVVDGYLVISPPIEAEPGEEEPD